MGVDAPDEDRGLGRPEVSQVRKMPKLPPLKKRERPFEYRLRDHLKTMDVMFPKCKPTIKGFPDRLAIGLGTMRLVEVKREDEDPDDVQSLVHRDIAAHGPEVVVVRGPCVYDAAIVIWRALGGE